MIRPVLDQLLIDLESQGRQTVDFGDGVVIRWYRDCRAGNRVNTCEVLRDAPWRSLQTRGSSLLARQ